MFATVLTVIAQNLIFILVWANVFLNSRIYLDWLKFKGAHRFCYRSAKQICLNNQGGVCVYENYAQRKKIARSALSSCYASTWDEHNRSEMSTGYGLAWNT